MANGDQKLPAQLDIEIKDRFGNPIVPREWFLVPRFVVDDAVERIKDGTITDYVYDSKQPVWFGVGMADVHCHFYIHVREQRGTRRTAIGDEAAH